MRTKLVILLTAAAIAAATLGSTSSDGATKRMYGTVGPGMTITVSRHSVVHGRYVFTARDKSADHNFHLIGPGVNKKTTISQVASKSWTITLRPGTYHYVCDAHPVDMKGTFKVT